MHDAVVTWPATHKLFLVYCLAWASHTRFITWHNILHQVSKPAAGRSRPPRARGVKREPDQADLAASDAVLGSGGSASTDAEEDGMLGDMGAEDCDASARSTLL